MKLILPASFMPAKGVTIKKPQKVPRANIAATMNNHHLDAFVPSGNSNEFLYHWKIFHNGTQFGKTIDGLNLISDLPDGDYDLYLSVERKKDHKIISATSLHINSHA